MGFRNQEYRTFGALIDAYRTEVYRYLWHLSRDAATADDLFQETFLKALPAFDRLRAGSNHRAWIYRIATNTFLNHRRRERRRPEADLDFEPASPMRTDLPQEQRELIRRCQAAILALPARQRAAFVQRTVQGLSYAMVARALGCTESAARAHVYQAMKRLRRQLRSDGPGDSGA